MDFFWNLAQSFRLQRQGEEIQSLREERRGDRDASRRLEALQEQLDRQLLASAAMWEIIRERLNLTDEDLNAAIQRVDLRDGQLDGRMTAPPKVCATCGRTFAVKRATCLYCGGPPKA
jgi:hypothetical protein